MRLANACLAAFPRRGVRQRTPLPSSGKRSLAIARNRTRTHRFLRVF
ncbi:RepB family protein [Xanthomonas vasicola]|nr:hypothetical protein [Xanthomonas vasicola pv. vasculorum]